MLDGDRRRQRARFTHREEDRKFEVCAENVTVKLERFAENSPIESNF
jgi:hypothetical protein